MDARIGLVVIGRNEGARLARALDSVAGRFAPAVYVDSGSTDASVELARARGFDVVRLDPAHPFTAARARNEGCERLLAREPGLELVQFLDGDCELDAGWIPRALEALHADPRAAVVCGRRRERHPDASIYNLLCDVEWNTPIGTEANSGGDALMRTSAFRDVGGFDPRLIAGEEPELCQRLRARGWRVRRIDAEMTLHDAALTRFSQWWLRAVRFGYTAAEGLRRAPDLRHARHLRPVASSIFWGGLFPLIVLAAALAPAAWLPAPARVAVLGACAALLLVLMARIHASRRRLGDPPRASWLYALYCPVGKLPELQGILTFAWRRLRARGPQLIEYKGAEPAPGAASGPDAS